MNLFDKELYFYFAFSQFYKNNKSKEVFIQLFFFINDHKKKTINLGLFLMSQKITKIWRKQMYTTLLLFL